MCLSLFPYLSSITVIPISSSLWINSFYPSSAGNGSFPSGRLESEAQAALVVFVLCWPLQEMETRSGLIVCPLAYSSHRKQKWCSLFDREFPNLSLCCVFTPSLCSPTDVRVCISVCLDLQGCRRKHVSSHTALVVAASPGQSWWVSLNPPLSKI